MLEWMLLFCLGALGYGGLELAFCGHTHWTMLLAGGICLCGMRAISLLRLPLLAQGLLSAAMITGVELAFGLVCNLALGWAVWDYSAQWGNYKGQICPLYSLFWLLLSLPLLAYFGWMDSTLRPPG